MKTNVPREIEKCVLRHIAVQCSAWMRSGASSSWSDDKTGETGALANQATSQPRRCAEEPTRQKCWSAATILRGHMKSAQCLSQPGNSCSAWLTSPWSDDETGMDLPTSSAAKQPGKRRWKKRRRGRTGGRSSNDTPASFCCWKRRVVVKTGIFFNAKCVGVFWWLLCFWSDSSRWTDSTVLASTLRPVAGAILRSPSPSFGSHLKSAEVVTLDFPAGLTPRPFQ
jgi:hypothetical protein